MPQVDIKNKRSKKPIFVGVGALGIVVIIVGGVLWYVGHPAVTTQTVLTQAADKEFSGDGKGAIAQLEQQLSHAKTNEDKVNIYLAIGVAYENEHDSKSALAAYQKAGAISASYGTNDSIARAAAETGDKPMAIDYYKRNLALINEGKAKESSGDAPTIEQAIKDLGGTP